MATPSPLRRTGQAPRALVWLLLAALLLQGGAAALAQVLGRAHTHRPVALQVDSGPGWMAGLMAWRAAKLAELQVAGVFRHVTPHADIHTHDGLERHHHGVGDDSVQALDGASDSDSGVSGTASVPWGPTAQPRRLPTMAAVGTWPPAPATRWSSAQAALPERPPRA